MYHEHTFKCKLYKAITQLFKSYKIKLNSWPDLIDDFYWRLFPQEWLEDVCERNMWDHRISPIIWRELLDRGGKGLLLGGYNEFLEHAQVSGGIAYVFKHIILLALFYISNSCFPRHSALFLLLYFLFWLCLIMIYSLRLTFSFLVFSFTMASLPA